MALCDEVITECLCNNCSVVHVAVDRVSPEGHVYLKCSTTDEASTVRNALTGRYFDGRLITAEFVPPRDYHEMFHSAREANECLYPTPPVNAEGKI
jgi:hypothetical protein